MILAIEGMIKEMAQHKAKMAAQRNVDNGHQTEVTLPCAQPESSSKALGASMTNKLVKFKKFAPPPFKEAQDQTEAEK